MNTTRSHEDAQHNGCITTLSGDVYGYPNETSGPFELTGNNVYDCPVHLFVKNSQGKMVNEDGINLLIKDNYFHGEGRLAQHFKASNVLFENNLFKGINGISELGTAGDYWADPHMCEITARNVTFRHNVFSGARSVIKMHTLGYLYENGPYSTAMEDKLKFYNNVVIVNDDVAATPGPMGWNQDGIIFSNTNYGMIDSQETPSQTLSRIYSVNNCYINKHGSNLAFVKHWMNGSESITGFNHSDAQSMYGINGEGDIFPTNTSQGYNFTNPAINDYSIKTGSPCSAIPNVGLLNPALFMD